MSNKKGEKTTTEDKTPTSPAQAEQPKPGTPTLSAEKKVQLLTLQRNVLLTQNQKLQADQQYEKAVAELNKQYQELMSKNPGFNFTADTLEFVPQQ